MLSEHNDTYRYMCLKWTREHACVLQKHTMPSFHSGHWAERLSKLCSLVLILIAVLTSLMSHWMDLAALLRMEHVIGTLGTVRERRGEEGEERLKRGACWQGLWCHCTARRKLGGGRGVVYTLKLTRRSSPVRHLRNEGRKTPSWMYVNAPASVFVKTIKSENTHMFAPRVSKICFLIKMQASTNTHMLLILIGCEPSPHELPVIFHLQLAIHHPSSLSRVSIFSATTSGG